LSLFIRLEEELNVLPAIKLQFGSLFNAYPDPLFLRDKSGTLLKANRPGLEFLGLENLSSLTIHEFSQDSIPSSRPDFEKRLSLLTESALSGDKENSFRTVSFSGDDSGKTTTLEISRILIRKTVDEFFIRVKDITRELEKQENIERYRLLFEHAREGIVITDSHRNIVEVNPSFTRVTGYTRGEILGKTPSLLKSGRQGKEFYDQMQKSLLLTGQWSGEIWDRKKSGELYCEWLSIYSLKKDGEVTHYLGIFSDITEHVKNQERILHLASHDVLTDLPNRRIFMERIEESIQRSQRSGERFVVGILDLDGFKSINDRLGHQVGDSLLVKVAKRLGGILRKTDMLARLGGDEFGLLLTGLSDSDFRDLFTRIVETLHLPFSLEDAVEERISVSGSLGLTLSPPDSGTPDSLLAHADLALYRVKDKGKDGWALFETQMAESLAKRHRIREEIERALDHKELLLHYQPQVNLTNGTILGLEALVRWNHPQKGLILPGSFIETVEAMPLISRLGRYVLDTAMTQQEEWDRSGLKVRISVNIGARHFLSGSFRKDLEELLSVHESRRQTPERMVIEITETETFRDLLLVQEMAEFCRDRGFFLSLDDFGTGQASLTALQKMPVSEIKVDRGFVRRILQNEKDRAIVASLLAAGQMMGIDVVAEGVETEEEGRILVGMGCRWGQGYAISPPLSPEQVPGWIGSWSPPPSWIDGAVF
jgi:diguanylate cyclase (GGDEF)-like protein/PAS domain S-box-containing protein